MLTLHNPYGEKPHFDGEAYTVADHARLTGQIADIKHLMQDGLWRTLDSIEKSTGHPPASISAQLRNLRKTKFGHHTIDRRHVCSGLYEYRLKPKGEPLIPPHLG